MQSVSIHHQLVVGIYFVIIILSDIMFVILNHSHFYWMNDGLINWLIGWLIDGMIEWLIAW